VAVARDTARISPLALLTSQAIRLRRLYPRAVYKQESEQLVLPIGPKATKGVAVVEAVRELLDALVPNATPIADPLASATP
jgi:hypothetical protein